MGALNQKWNQNGSQLIIADFFSLAWLPGFYQNDQEWLQMYQNNVEQCRTLSNNVEQCLQHLRVTSLRWHLAKLNLFKDLPPPNPLRLPSRRLAVFKRRSYDYRRASASSMTTLMMITTTSSELGRSQLWPIPWDQNSQGTGNRFWKRTTTTTTW